MSHRADEMIHEQLTIQDKRPMAEVVQETMGTETEDGSLTQQLYSFYEEKELLNDKIGASSADEIITMIENLDLQLRDFYQDGDQS